MSADPIKGRSDAHWRKNIGDMQRLLADLAIALFERTDLAIEEIPASVIIRRAAHLLNSAEANVRAEERHAWDQFAASVGSSVDWLAQGCTVEAASHDAANFADHLLEERRKRFARKEEL